jgi:hypothetical protein
MLAGDIPEQFHHLPTTMAIQCSGGFVSENHARMIGQSSGNGNIVYGQSDEYGNQATWAS